MPSNKSVRGDDTNSSQPWMENVATTEFCQFVLPVTKGKAMLLFLSFLPSLTPHNSPPLPKNPLPALQGAAEPLLYSFLNLCHLFRSLSLSFLSTGFKQLSAPLLFVSSFCKANREVFTTSISQKPCWKHQCCTEEGGGG